MFSNKFSSILINIIFRIVIKIEVLNILIFYVFKCYFKYLMFMLSVKCNILFIF